ncbi:unnamed protein product [Onchocerca flexuosa]|uniref:SUN domain-containing protein n=1 Tax=Onchocerca flexuosa TaxID=387005 RepID=A0A183HUL9_9BILA|nr:unnamed protein product [Onchocerca flexuosa]
MFKQTGKRYCLVLNVKCDINSDFPILIYPNPLLQSDFNTPVSIVELVVQSNWDSDYTCLYRFRVHGRKA